MGRALSTCLTRLDLGGAVADVGHRYPESRQSLDKWTLAEGKDRCDICTARQLHRDEHVDRSSANMHCAGDVESSFSKSHRRAGFLILQRHSSVTVTTPTNHSPDTLTEGPWFIVEMAGYQPLPYRWE